MAPKKAAESKSEKAKSTPTAAPASTTKMSKGTGSMRKKNRLITVYGPPKSLKTTALANLPLGRTKWIASDPNCVACLTSLDRLPHEVVVDKTHLDGFAHTTLADTLATFGARRVVLAGAYAGRCVLSTALGATCNGFDVEVVTDSVMYHPAVPGELDVLSALVTSSLGTVVGRAEVARRWQHRSR